MVPCPLHGVESCGIAARVRVGFSQGPAEGAAQLIIGCGYRDAEHLVWARRHRTFRHSFAFDGRHGPAYTTQPLCTSLVPDRCGRSPRCRYTQHLRNPQLIHGLHAYRDVVTSISDIPLTTIDGTTTSLSDYADKVVLIVNVASRCGLAPQYEKLEALQKTYGERGFTVLGFPSNQFLQELGTEDKIKEYCSMTWGVTFPMFGKVKLNGRSAHPLYQELTKTPDTAGKAGRVAWNFEKFVITPAGDIHRFRPTVEPDAPEIVSLIEGSLPSPA